MAFYAYGTGQEATRVAARQTIGNRIRVGHALTVGLKHVHTNLGRKRGSFGTNVRVSAKSGRFRVELADYYPLLAGRYRIVGVLGQGAFSITVQAIDEWSSPFGSHKTPGYTSQSGPAPLPDSQAPGFTRTSEQVRLVAIKVMHSQFGEIGVQEVCRMQEAGCGEWSAAEWAQLANWLSPPPTKSVHECRTEALARFRAENMVGVASKTSKEAETSLGSAASGSTKSPRSNTIIDLLGSGPAASASRKRSAASTLGSLGSTITPIRTSDITSKAVGSPEGHVRQRGVPPPAIPSPTTNTKESGRRGLLSLSRMHAARRTPPVHEDPAYQPQSAGHDAKSSLLLSRRVRANMTSPGAKRSRGEMELLPSSTGHSGVESSSRQAVSTRQAVESSDEEEEEEEEEEGPEMHYSRHHRPRPSQGASPYSGPGRAGKRRRIDGSKPVSSLRGPELGPGPSAEDGPSIAKASPSPPRKSIGLFEPEPPASSPGSTKVRQRHSGGKLQPASSAVDGRGTTNAEGHAGASGDGPREAQTEQPAGLLPMRDSVDYSLVKYLDCFQYFGHFCIVMELRGPSLLEVYDLQPSEHLASSYPGAGEAVAASTTSAASRYSATRSNTEHSGRRPASCSWQAVSKVARRLFTALAHLARRGIVHADVKPDNILSGVATAKALIAKSDAEKELVEAKRLESKAKEASGRMRAVLLQGAPAAVGVRECDRALEALRESALASASSESRAARSEELLRSCRGDPSVVLADLGNSFSRLGRKMYVTDFQLQPAGYRAPEIVVGESIGPACDVFAVGVVLLELCAGSAGILLPNADDIRIARGMAAGAAGQAQRVERLALLVRMQRVLGRMSTDLWQRGMTAKASQTAAAVRGAKFLGHVAPCLAGPSGPATTSKPTTAALMRKLRSIISKARQGCTSGGSTLAPSSTPEALAPPILVDLLARCLDYDPRSRVSALEALSHPFLLDCAPCPVVELGGKALHSSSRAVASRAGGSRYDLALRPQEHQNTTFERPSGKTSKLVASSGIGGASAHLGQDKRHRANKKAQRATGGQVEPPSPGRDAAAVVSTSADPSARRIYEEMPRSELDPSGQDSRSRRPIHSPRPGSQSRAVQARKAQGSLAALSSSSSSSSGSSSTGSPQKSARASAASSRVGSAPAGLHAPRESQYYYSSTEAGSSAGQSLPVPPQVGSLAGLVGASRGHGAAASFQAEGDGPEMGRRSSSRGVAVLARRRMQALQRYDEQLARAVGGSLA